MWPFRFGKTLAAKHPNQRQEGARTALIVLSCINLLNYADRYVPSAVKPLLKADLNLSDVQTSLPFTGMVLVYTVAAVIFGWVADNRFFDRRILLASGVFFWSVATALAGVARNFMELMIFRALVGVGEAAFVTISFPMLADFYPICDRNLAYMVFSLCSPLGGALGYVAGALFGSWFSWRVAFFICGIPGIVVSVLIIGLNDPSPGVNDPKVMKEGLQDSGLLPNSGERRRSWIVRQSAMSDVFGIFAVKHWDVAVIGMVSTSFVVGVLADWYETYLVRRVDGVTVEKAGLVLGLCTLVGGILGNFLGSVTVQGMSSRWKNAALLVPALFMIPACGFLFLAVNVTSSAYGCYAFALLAWIMFFTYMAPLNCVMYNSMPVHLRARAGAISVLLSHVLGDVISPPIVGAISQSTGSLQLGMQLCWIMTSIAGLAWGIGGLLLKPLPEASDDTSSRATSVAGATDDASPPADSVPSLSSLFLEGEEPCEEEQEGDASPEKLKAPGYGATASSA